LSDLATALERKKVTPFESRTTTVRAKGKVEASSHVQAVAGAQEIVFEVSWRSNHLTQARQSPQSPSYISSSPVVTKQSYGPRFAEEHAGQFRENLLGITFK